MEEKLSRLDGKVFRKRQLSRQSAGVSGSASEPGRRLARIFSAHFPTWKNLRLIRKQELFQIRPLLDAAGLDAMHSLSGPTFSFEGAKTRVQGRNPGRCRCRNAIWTSGPPGSRRRLLFRFVPAECSFLHPPRNLIFQGIYDTVKRVARALFPRAQQGNTDLFGHCRAVAPRHACAGTRFALLTGGIRFDANEPVAGPAKASLLFGIRKETGRALKLIRSHSAIGSLRSAMKGEVTFLKNFPWGKQTGTGVAQWKFFQSRGHARTWFLGAIASKRSRKAFEPRARFRRRTRHRAAISGAPHPIPRKISLVLGYFDFQKVDWQALKGSLDRRGEEKALWAKKRGLFAKTAPSTAPDWLTQIQLAKVFARHLHYSFECLVEGLEG